MGEFINRFSSEADKILQEHPADRDPNPRIRPPPARLPAARPLRWKRLPQLRPVRCEPGTDRQASRSPRSVSFRKELVHLFTVTTNRKHRAPSRFVAGGTCRRFAVSPPGRRKDRPDPNPRGASSRLPIGGIGDPHTTEVNGWITQVDRTAVSGAVFRICRRTFVPVPAIPRISRN